VGNRKKKKKKQRRIKMKIDFSPELTNLAGDPLKEGSADGTSGDTLTLQTVCVNALLSEDPAKKVSGVDKKKRGDLADRIYAQEDKEGVSVDIKELSLLKDLIGEVYPPIIVKRAWDLLDPPDDENDEDEEKPKKKVKPKKK
jgi:hypothetical protein